MRDGGPASNIWLQYYAYSETRYDGGRFVFNPLWQTKERLVNSICILVLFT